MGRVRIVIGSDFPKVVIPLIKDAEKSIKIIVYDWRWYPQNPGASCQRFNQAILSAHKRNVKVEAITNTRKTVQRLKKIGVGAKILHSYKLVHIKLMIIDDEKIIVGSHNYSESAFEKNYELSVLLENPKNKGRFINFFNNLYG